ncbi:Ino4p ASCRUDRAFT_28586, partial [Ascoidea rubescens DSM 1968]
KTSFLTEEQKKAHHIASEQKRRQAIRSAFDRIVNLVPNLSVEESRTEVAVLTKSANYLKDLYDQNQVLVNLLISQKINIHNDLILNRPSA